MRPRTRCKPNITLSVAFGEDWTPRHRPLGASRGVATEGVPSLPDNVSSDTGQHGLGSRIHVIGNSCSGKSYVGSCLAEILDLPLVELDALNWEPNWIGLNDHDPAEFERRIRKATEGDSWVVAGSYISFSQRAFWGRLQTVIWLDLPLPRLLGRAITRSWRRWRSEELLWGTNYERFWSQLLVWRKADSLIWWITTQQRRKRRSMLRFAASPEWSYIRFIRFTSSFEVEEFLATVRGAVVDESRTMGRDG